jgi:hypothetical protein
MVKPTSFHRCLLTFDICFNPKQFSIKLTCTLWIFYLWEEPDAGRRELFQQRLLS